MQKGDFLSAILKSAKTVLTVDDIALIWRDSNSSAVKSRLSYYVRNGDLYRIRRGIYAKNNKYNKLELATRVFTPSYVSFETILAQEGLIFQYQTKIQLASYLGREIEIDGQIYCFRKLKDSIITNSVGIENINETSLASRERAFLDILYTNNDYHFDNLRSLDWGKVMAMLPIYENKRMTKIVSQLWQQSKI